MEIYDYATAGGKNLILSDIDCLPAREKLQILDMRQEIRKNGIDALEKFTTRQIRGKMWEIKITQYRIFYILIDRDRIVFLHMCKKQKGKAEKQEIHKAWERARREGLL